MLRDCWRSFIKMDQVKENIPKRTLCMRVVTGSDGSFPVTSEQTPRCEAKGGGERNEDRVSQCLSGGSGIERNRHARRCLMAGGGWGTDFHPVLVTSRGGFFPDRTGRPEDSSVGNQVECGSEQSCCTGISFWRECPSCTSHHCGSGTSTTRTGGGKVKDNPEN